MSRANMYVLSSFMRHDQTGEYRMLINIEVAASEEEASVKASLMAHPGQGEKDHWIVLSRHVEAVERETLERAAREVLGWKPTAEEEAI
jgi:hypothetical protein